ncbi:MAG: Asp-tRNA(Asn)/Glu-tRNA(Gln) amidotransferase subunit GatB [Thermotogota bacterium]|nr:Asp-tRNA(Asn)/Glu-tRNA(Gln) amidotransferase subunit GatB [Thermotogota bacterium]
MLKTIIGLEIHAQLQTASKAFCRCVNNSQSSPNSNCCPVCTGQPGSLPSLNKKMVELALKASLAFHCEVRRLTSFDRKNYFSRDMPKGYQITQFFHPIGKNGFVEILTEMRKEKITINSVHMEEDSARTLIRKDNDHEDQTTLLDYNRSGIPLLEIVTAPEIASAKGAVDCFETIRMILLYLNVCDGHMEAGSLRCDANISLQKTETNESTGRVEIKNLNTFKNLERALRYEETQLKESFGSFKADQAITKNWDERCKCTKVSRDKETLKDYRHFKEPDLPVICISEEQIQDVKDQIPELPLKRLERLMNEYDLRFDIVNTLIADRPLADFFEQAMSISKAEDMKHTIIRDVKGYLNHTGKQIYETQLTPEKLYYLLQSIKTGRIAPMMKQKLLEKLFETAKTVDTIIEEENLIKIDDRNSLKVILEEIITENEEQYEAYICGKKELFKWFIGQMIKRTKGRADPKQIISIIKERMGD